MFGKTKIKIFLFPIKKLIIWATSFPGPLLFHSPGGEEERPWERSCKNSRAFVPVRLFNLNPCFCAWDSFSRFVFKVIRQLLLASSMYSGFESKNQSYCSDQSRKVQTAPLSDQKSQQLQAPCRSARKCAHSKCNWFGFCFSLAEKAA